MIVRGLLGVAAAAALGVESQAQVSPRRRCACCRVPSNRCPCRVCGACTTSGGEPGAHCACGRRAAGEVERSELGALEDPR